MRNRIALLWFLFEFDYTWSLTAVPEKKSGVNSRAGSAKKMYITTEPYKFEGYWSFSKDQSCWFSGTLEYSPESHKIELRMWGQGERVNLDFQSDTIIGRTTDEKKITLLNCIIRKTSSRAFPSDSNGKTFLHIVEATRILIGEHHNNFNEINYSSLSIRYSDQFDFIQTDGFHNDHFQGRPSITYNKPEKIVLLKTDTIEIKICFFGTFGHFGKPANVSSIVQQEYFDFNFHETQDLNLLRNEINMLKYFIAFSISKDVFPLECSFGNRADNDGSEDERIDLLSDSFFKIKRNDNKTHHHGNIIEIGDFQNEPDLYEKWRSLFREKESAIYKFFSTIYDDRYFLDEQFHKLVMAFEDYHRNSPEFCQTVVNQRGQRRDVFLRERIESIFEKFHKQLLYLFKDLSEKDRVIKLIRDSRDFLTHGGDVRKEVSVKDPNSYFGLTDLLISIIALMILNDLGFSENVIKDKIWNLPSYYHLVDKDWSVVQ